MPFLNVTQYSGASVNSNVVIPAPVEPAIDRQQFDIASTSEKSTQFNDACQLVSIVSDVDFRYVVGDSATVTVGTDTEGTFVPAGQTLSFVPAGDGFAIAARTNV